MQITMTGIDHNRAPISLREQFSFTKAQAMAAMERIKTEYGLSGCLLISTCNRTELWTSGNPSVPLREMLCQLKGFSSQGREDYFVDRHNDSAVNHLFELACGLDSRIFGEDQIISQVKEALLLARKCQTEDMALEKLFQTAISAAKRVKSEVRLTTANANPSTAGNVVSLLLSRMESLKEVPCLIIGNGQMGRLVAAELTMRGAEVSMTLRKRIHGREEQTSIVPDGCAMIPYEDRLEKITDYKVVVSATLSPHYTILKEDMQAASSERPGRFDMQDMIWLDLAVPRDIEPACGDLGAKVYDIDDLAAFSGSRPDESHVEKARVILEDYKESLYRWFGFRRQIPQIQHITRLAAVDTEKRLAEPMEMLSPEIREELSDAIQQAAEKSVGKLLYGLKDTLPSDLWETCLAALVESAQRDTLKS